MNEINSSSCGAKIIVAVGGLLVLGLLASGIVRWQDSRQQAEVEQEEAKREAQEEAQREAAYMTRWKAEEAARAAKEEEAKAEAMAESARRETLRKRDVVVSAAALGRFSATDFGNGITREHCVAMMCDDKATELARHTFSKNATGQVVRWLLELSNVQVPDNSGSLVADFKVSYAIQVPNGWARSEFRVRAVFPATEREQLLTLRRGDWATVEGRLQLENAPTLLDARIALPTDAEAPAR